MKGRISSKGYQNCPRCGRFRAKHDLGLSFRGFLFFRKAIRTTVYVCRNCGERDSVEEKVK